MYAASMRDSDDVADLRMIRPADRGVRFTRGRLLDILRSFSGREVDQPSRRPDDAPKVRYHPAFRWASYERMADERASVWLALEALGSLRPDRFERTVVWRYYVVGDSERHIATILRTDLEAVKLARQDGIDWMLRWLNGE